MCGVVPLIFKNCWKTPTREVPPTSKNVNLFHICNRFHFFSGWRSTKSWPPHMATCRQVPSDLDKDIWWQLSSRTMQCDIFCHNFVLFGTFVCNMLLLVVRVFSLSSRYGCKTLRDIRMRAKLDKDWTFFLVKVFKFCNMQRRLKQWLHILWCWNVKHSMK